MNERVYYNLSDRDWGEGPWQDEPDKVVWVDDTTGLDCMILRNSLGALCGYVGVPEGHPWHGKPTESVDVASAPINFAAPCETGMTEDQWAICHNPEGRPDNIWWLGFDCMHMRDLVPSMAWLTHKYDLLKWPETYVYQDVNRVRARVTVLALEAQYARRQ